MTHQRSVIVTGAGTGIGRATAALLRQKGWRVFASMWRPNPERHGPDALALDVTSDETVSAAATRPRSPSSGLGCPSPSSQGLRRQF